MEREQRNLDGEREEESQEEPVLLRRVENQISALQVCQNRRKVKGCGAVQKVKGDDGHQHEHRTHHRVEEKLDGCVDAALPAPDANQEVHGHQHHFPKNVEKEKVEGDKNPNHAGFQHQHEEVILTDSVLNRIPRTENSDGCENSGQQNQKQTDPVNSDVILDAET